MTYSKRYSHLNEPIVLPNGVMLHSRVISGCSQNNYVQGNLFSYPTDDMITYYANRAKNGASMLLMTGMGDPNCVEGYVRPRKIANLMKDIPMEAREAHQYHFEDWFTFWDVLDKKNHVRFTKLTEEVHLHQALIINQMIPYLPVGYDVSAGDSSAQYAAIGGGECKELSKEYLQGLIDMYVEWAIAEKQCGFDGVEMLVSHDGTVGSRLLSPVLNRRTDEYGGSLENRARFVVDWAKAMKKACGDKFIVMLRIDPGGRPTSISREEMIEFIKLLDGYVDLISVFHPDLINDRTHPTTYDYGKDKYPNLENVKAVKAGVKAAGVNIPIAAIGGFLDLDDMEAELKKESFDLFDCARAWISNPEFGKLMREGRGEDVVPCLRCSNCHQLSVLTSEVWCKTQCSVNPLWGMENRVERLSDPPTCKKSVGIVGGGATGMRAALYAAERGHDVTIYEKSGALGGLLNAANGIDFKWVLSDYKNWLIRQVRKNPNIHVELNMEADRDLLQAKGHEAVLVAIGADVAVPSIPGIENAGDCYSFMVEKKPAGKNVVIIGGGDVGIDCGMDLAKRGHNVTVLELGAVIAAASARMHAYAHMHLALAKLPNMSVITKAKTTNITANSVEYVDAEGNAHTVEADTILFATGLTARPNDVCAFSDAASYKLYSIGDCKKPGSLLEHNRDAMGAGLLL